MHQTIHLGTSEKNTSLITGDEVIGYRELGGGSARFLEVPKLQSGGFLPGCLPCQCGEELMAYGDFFGEGPPRFLEFLW